MRLRPGTFASAHSELFARSSFATAGTGELNMTAETVEVAPAPELPPLRSVHTTNFPPGR